MYVTIVSRSKFMRTPRKKIFDLIEYIARKTTRPVHDVDIAVVDSREMAKYNREYLSHAGTTDVISFDLSGDDKSLSVQLIVCGQVAVREAAKRSHGEQKELLLYVTHGMLHLMGYDDQKSSDATRMYERQEKLLDGFLDEYHRQLKKTSKKKGRKQ